MSTPTQIFDRLQAIDFNSSAELLPLVYEDLRRLASRRLASDGENGFETTDLVHETYLRLIGNDLEWEGRRHFFGAAAEAMRRILVDRARRRNRVKHGGNQRRLTLSESMESSSRLPDEILIVHDLFELFSEKHPAESEVAKLRYFAGFNCREVGEILDISVSTAHSRWKFAKAWLYREYQKR